MNPSFLRRVPLAYSKHNPDPSSLSADSPFDLMYQEKAQPSASEPFLVPLFPSLPQAPAGPVDSISPKYTEWNHFPLPPLWSRPPSFLSHPYPSPDQSFFFLIEAYLIWGFSGGSVVKNLPAKQETQVQPWVRKIPWRKKWHPTPVFLPGKSQGQRSLVVYSP